jgi:tetratricopeptide (TPR) repeat protein
MNRITAFSIGCVWLLAAVMTACGTSDSGQNPTPAPTPAGTVVGFAEDDSQATPAPPAGSDEATPFPTLAPPSQLPAPNAQATPRGRLDSDYTRHYRAGDDAKVTGDYELAVKEYTQAINIIPDITRAFTIRGETYLYLGQYQKAVDDFEAAIDHRRNRRFRLRGTLNGLRSDG